MSDWDAWIGRGSTTRTWLDPDQANRMAETLDRETGFASGDPVPPGWHWLYGPDLVRASQLGPEGHPRLGTVLPPVGLPRRMWAGGTLSFQRPLLLGTTVERHTTIRSVQPKTGRSGPLCFVTVEHAWRTGGAVNLVEQQTIVYRELTPDAEVPAAGAAPTDAGFTTRWALDSTALFRYSALTFNGHRIHYDADYCRRVEHYPDLVIHGPLIATLLLDLAVRHGRSPAGFSYRARSPLFLPHPFTVNGRASGDRTALWACDHAGGLAMTGEVWE